MQERLFFGRPPGTGPRSRQAFGWSTAVRTCRGRCWRVSATASAAAAAETAGGGAVLILPGFLSGARQYEGMASVLRARGFTAEIVPLEFKEWIPVLSGASFRFYTEKVSAELARLYEAQGRVALVGHSAGGWVARLVLGDQPYEGTEYGHSSMVHTLVTLGTPHHSREEYPFGRVEEQLSGDNLAGAPPEVRGSSLKFTNYFYPRGDAFPGVRVVCIVGDAIAGRPLFGSGSSSSGAGEAGAGGPSPWQSWGSTLSVGSLGSEDLGGGEGGAVGGGLKAPGRLDRYFAFESYKSGCGRGEVEGDGVTPVEIAHLPGAENLVLPGVWHSPPRKPGRRWYGTPEVVDLWQQYLIPAGAAAAQSASPAPSVQ